MANDNLRQALKHADLKPDDFAELIEVNIRTVRRWLSGKTPYPRHRAKIARALQINERVLWPEIPTAAEIQAATPTRDHLTGYPSTDSIGIPSTEGLIRAASEQIDLLDHTLTHYLRPNGLTQLLIHKASQGTRIRIMITQPDHHLTPLLHQPGIELRAIDPQHQAIHRYDNDMLLPLTLAGELDDPPPLIHIQRRDTGGLFDRLAEHYQDIWETATRPLQTEADIERYVSEDEPALDQEVEEAVSATVAPEARPGLSAPERRWPRRPT